MAILPIIVELEKKGNLKPLIKAGILSTKVGFYYEIYLEYDKRKKTSKKTSSYIVDDLAEVFNVSRQTIYKAIKTFK